MTLRQALLIFATASFVAGQRPSFAGRYPIGYPAIISSTAATASTNNLGNRFGENNSTTSNTSSTSNNSTISTTTQRIPIEANGDRDLVDRLSKLPIDKQPFWFINWQAYEANRNKPQTYPIRPSSFAQPISPGFNSNNNFNAEGNLGNKNTQNELNVPNIGVQNNSGFSSNVSPNGNTGTVSDTNLGNRKDEIDLANTAIPLAQPSSPVRDTVKLHQTFQPSVNNAAFVTNPESQVSGNNLGNRFGSENSGSPTATFKPSFNIQPSRPVYPGKQNLGSNIGGNRYPGQHTFGLNSYPGGQYFRSNLEGNRYSNSGANLGGVPNRVWANQYQNQFAYDGSNIGRFRRDLEDTEAASGKNTSFNALSVDSSVEVILAQIEKSLRETIDIWEKLGQNRTKAYKIHEKYDDDNSEKVDSSVIRKETPVEEAIRKQECENREKLAAHLSRAPTGHVKCDEGLE